jgi:hypothetical protein
MKKVALKRLRQYYKLVDNLGILSELKYYNINNCIDDYNLLLDMLIADKDYKYNDYKNISEKSLNKIKKEIENINNDIELLLDIIDISIDEIIDIDDNIFNMIYDYKYSDNIIIELK